MLGLSFVTPQYCTSAVVSALFVTAPLETAWAFWCLGWLELEAPSYPVSQATLYRSTIGEVGCWPLAGLPWIPPFCAKCYSATPTPRH